MTDLSRRSGVICAGNWIVDIVHDIAEWPNKNELVRILGNSVGIGGGAANVLSDLRSFEVDFPLIPVGKLGKDNYADLVFDHCRKFDFPLDFMKQDEVAPTAHTHVMNLSGDSRTFFYQGGANDMLSQDDLPMQALADQNAKIFYLGYPMLLAKLDALHEDGSTQAAKILEQARDAGMITCVDLVSTGSLKFEAIISASLPHIDYLVINETELSRASGMNVTEKNGELCRSMMQIAGQYLLNCGVNKAVVVHSPKLALWLAANGNAVWSVPQEIAVEDIISPVGAGDAFCAGVVFGVHEGWKPDRILKLAHRAARAALGGMTATDGIQPISQLMPDYVPSISTVNA